MNVTFENEPGPKIMHDVILYVLGLKDLPSASVDQPRRIKKPAVNPAPLVSDSSHDAKKKWM